MKSAKRTADLREIPKLVITQIVLFQTIQIVQEQKLIKTQPFLERLYQTYMVWLKLISHKLVWRWNSCVNSNNNGTEEP